MAWIYIKDGRIGFVLTYLHLIHGFCVQMFDLCAQKLMYLCTCSGRRSDESLSSGTKHSEFNPGVLLGVVVNV
jgi:hypothetical protein